MAPDSGEPDAAALRDRVAELEQTVADQQATIESLQQPPASRRGVLAALTGVAGAGALGAYSQRGAAQAAGQVGTQSEPVDVVANTIDANEVETGVVDIDDVTAGASSEIVRSGISSTKLHKSSIEFTDGVGTSATPIFDRTEAQIRGARADVFVRTGGSEYATEQVLVTFGGDAKKVDSQPRGTVPSTTYSIDTGSLTLAMGSGSADVVVSATEFNTSDPTA